MLIFKRSIISCIKNYKYNHIAGVLEFGGSEQRRSVVVDPLITSCLLPQNPKTPKPRMLEKYLKLIIILTKWVKGHLTKVKTIFKTRLINWRKKREAKLNPVKCHKTMMITRISWGHLKTQVIGKRIVAQFKSFLVACLMVSLAEHPRRNRFSSLEGMRVLWRSLRVGKTTI